MTDPNPELVERVVQAQAGHFLRVAPVHCTCGWRSGTYSEPDGFARLKAHMAELAISAVADDLRAEGAAEALHAALYDLEITKNSHDGAECAAPVPGEVGRQDAIDEWISICDEPVEWMRKFAQRYAHEAPSDAYIREVEEEARAEGRREVFDALRVFRAEADKPLAVDLGNMVRHWLDEREADQ